MMAPKRLHLMVLIPIALAALTACGQQGDPAQTVERDAGTDAVPARPIGDAMQMQPVEGGAAPEAVELSRTEDGGMKIRKVDAAVGQDAGASPSRAESKH